jgi:outer membrane protein assembly factor BamB
MKRCRSFLASSSMLLLLAGTAAADNWPQWRGANHDGISVEKNLPTEWDATKNVAWKLKLPGMGGSTPAIWGDHLFLTSQDGSDIALLCIRTEGKELWRRKLGSGTPKYRGDEGNGASASPSTDGKHVWVFTGAGDLACFDFDGNESWRFNAQERYGRFNIQHGMHSTPLLDGDRLYVQLLHGNGFHVIALDKATGKEIWKIERPSDGRGEGKHSYASPVLWRKGKDAYLIVHGCDYATAHRLDDGREIWRVGGLNPKDHYNATLRFVTSPLATPDLIVVPTAKHGPVVGLKPDATGLVEPGSRFEQWRLPKSTPDVPSPLIHDGLLYLCGESGQLTCLEAKTGKELYSQKLHAARYRGSPVYAGGMIYLTARDGVVTVVKAGPKFEQVAVNTLPDQIAASPAVSGGRIYLRGFDTLYAIGPAAK